MNISRLPRHLGTSREFKTEKRRAFRKVRKAVDEFRMGCAYSPVYDIDPVTRKPYWDAFESLLKRFETSLSIKEWGR